MARIPQFTRTVLLDRSQPSNIDAAFAAGGGNQARQYEMDSRRSYQNSQAAGALLNQHMEQKQAEARVNAQSRYNEFERERIKALKEKQNERQANPTGFTEEFDKWHTDQLAQFEAKLGEDGDQNIDIDYFRQLMDRDRTQAFQGNTDWENGMRVKNTFIGAESGIDEMNTNFMLSNPSYKDFVDHQHRVKDYVNEVGGKLFSPEDQKKLFEFGVDNAANAFFDERLQNNPKSVKNILEYGRGGRDAMIQFVMNDIEGGGRYVKDGKGYAKYGINSAANKDIDVKSLTPEAAVELYKNRYWDKRLDSYDPAFQAVAFDALVNHGNDKDTWAMIEQAKENPQALISLRQQEYARLIAADPATYKDNEKGWQRRLNTLNDYAKDLQSGGSEFLQNAGLVDSKIIAGARSKVNEAIARKVAQEEKAALEATKVDTMTLIANQNALMEEIETGTATYDEKMLKINRMEVMGGIKQEFAADIRRYMESKKAVNAVTNDPLMADVVTQMYDLNATADMNEADYLRGVQNIKRKIMNLRSDGTLSREDEEKLNNQLRTLTSAKVSDATTSVAFSFGEANKLIEQGLPPELRGKATRELFYKVDEESAKGKELSQEDERKLYKTHARAIIDRINTERRNKALSLVNESQTTVNIEQDKATQDFLTQKGYTMDDVRETAKKHGMTEKQVIQHIQNQAGK